MIDIERKDLALMMECGYIMVGMQRFKEARQVFEGIAVMAPDSEIPIVAQGSVSFCEGKFKEAVKHYNKAMKLNKDSLFAQAYLGEALFFLGETDKSIEQLQGVVKKDGEGKAGQFAKALLEAINQGFTPDVLSGVEDFKESQAKQKGK